MECPSVAHTTFLLNMPHKIKKKKIGPRKTQINLVG